MMLREYLPHLAACRGDKPTIRGNGMFHRVRRATVRTQLLALLIAVAVGCITLMGSVRSHADDPFDPNQTPPPPPPNAVPEIVDFMATQDMDATTLSGQVIDENPVGMVVTFGGPLAGQQTTVTEASGFFTYSTDVEGPATVTATTVDDHDQQSDTVYTTIP